MPDGCRLRNPRGNHRAYSLIRARGKGPTFDEFGPKFSSGCARPASAFEFGRAVSLVPRAGTASLGRGPGGAAEAEGSLPPVRLCFLQAGDGGLALLGRLGLPSQPPVRCRGRVWGARCLPDPAGNPGAAGGAWLHRWSFPPSRRHESRNAHPSPHGADGRHGPARAPADLSVSHCAKQCRHPGLPQAIIPPGRPAKPR
jgi:hypothetical protein